VPGVPCYGNTCTFALTSRALASDDKNTEDLTQVCTAIPIPSQLPNGTANRECVPPPPPCFDTVPVTPDGPGPTDGLLLVAD
jgi:hypothetical protein